MFIAKLLATLAALAFLAMALAHMWYDETAPADRWQRTARRAGNAAGYGFVILSVAAAVAWIWA